MKDKLSALLDGDLDEQSMRPVFDAIRRDRSLRTDWEAYCIIGDVLRGVGDSPPGLVARVMTEIESEPTVLAPRAAVAQPERWRSLMPLAASVMGVAAVGWVAYTLYAQPDRTAPLASVDGSIQPVASVSAPVRTVADVPAIDRRREYVFAHQAMTAGGPLSGVIQHVRTVSDVSDAGR